MHIARIITFGIFIMPIMASTVVCIVIALFTFIVPPQGKTYYEFLWLGALIVGVPTSLIGTLIFAPMASSFRNRPIGCVVHCGVGGAALGYLGYAILSAKLLSIGSHAARPWDWLDYLMYTTATTTGCVSGVIFGVVAYGVVTQHFAQMLESSDDKHP